MLAVLHDDLVMVRLLLEVKADVNVKDKYGSTTLAYVFDKGYDDIERLLRNAGAK